MLISNIQAQNCTSPGAFHLDTQTYINRIKRKKAAPVAKQLSFLPLPGTVLESDRKLKQSKKKLFIVIVNDRNKYS